MKAKDVLSLCEDTQLSAEELYNLILQYSKKRFNLLGFRQHAVMESLWQLKLALGNDSISDRQLQRKKHIQYIKGLSKFWGHGRVDTSAEETTFYLGITDDVSQSMGYIFEVEVYRPNYIRNLITVVVGFSRMINQLNWVSQGPETIKTVTMFEDKINEIYELIDLIAKAVRLTPVE